MGERLAAVLGLVGFFLLLGACHRSPPHFRETNITGVPWGGAFTLTGTNGALFHTAALRGNVVLLYFGYTRCTDVCRPTLERLAALERRLGADATRVKVVFVSIDARHDTPARLRRFIDRIDPRFIALTGSPAAIARVAAQFKVAYRRNPKAPPDERFTHSDGIFIEDPTGQLRLYAPGTAPLRDLAHDIHLLLANR